MVSKTCIDEHNDFFFFSVPLVASDSEARDGNMMTFLPFVHFVVVDDYGVYFRRKSNGAYAVCVTACLCLYKIVTLNLSFALL
jgi:hypothetical protein